MVQDGDDSRPKKKKKVMKKKTKRRGKDFQIELLRDVQRTFASSQGLLTNIRTMLRHKINPGKCSTGFYLHVNNSYPSLQLSRSTDKPEAHRVKTR